MHADLFEKTFDFGRPTGSHTEPLFWISELRILRKFSPDGDDEIRSIPFRKGLNVVWAKPYSSDDKGTENRLSGHAAGKTTLCRFIRYLFGEHHFASESVEQSIRESEAFRYSWVVAEVRVEGVTWSVGKPFSQPSRGLCKENCTLDEFLRMGSERSAFSVIEKKLQEILKEITPIQKFDDGSSLSFWQLFPWFTRDQECQFMDLDSWRNNPKSGAESPFLSRERAMLAVRSTFDKTIAKEIELLTLQAQLAREKEDAERALMVIDKMLDKDGEVGASLGLTIGDGSLWDDQSVKKLEEKLSQNDFVSEVSPMLDDVEGRLKTLLEQRASLQSLYAGARARYNNKKAVIQEQNKTQRIEQEIDEHLEEIKKMMREHPEREFCCTPLEVALINHCPCMTIPDEDAQSKKNLEEAIRNQDGGICSKKETLATYEKVFDKLKRALADLDSEIEQTTDLVNEFRKQYQRDYRDCIQKAAEKIAVVKRYRENLREKESIQSSLATIKKNQDKCSEALSNRRRKAKQDELPRLVELYDQVLRYVLGEGVVGEIKIIAGRIELKCRYHGPLDSSAINGVKNVCFDLAVMIHSIEGGGSHPRFLVHDGPRVADLSSPIFGRYFELMRDLEQKAADQPNFQYIITTTGDPPEDFQKRPWLACELNASQPQTRLLKTDLA